MFILFHFCVTFSIFVKYIYVRIKCESEVNLYDLKKTGPFIRGKKLKIHQQIKFKCGKTQP